MLKLENVTGLHDDSPLHCHLKVFDELVKDKNSWAAVHRSRLTAKVLWEGFLVHLGHPTERKVDLANLNDYIAWLHIHGENVLGQAIDGMLARVDVEGIRLAIMFILANLDYLKEREAQEAK